MIPAAQDVVLFDWLKTLYPIWAELEPVDVYLSTRLALTELLLSGCTTSSDHHYLWPNGTKLDDQFAAAESVGVRFHGARGSMSLGESQGGLPPDRVTEPEDAILADCRRVVETFHDSSRFAMRRVVLAPCSPFSVTRARRAPIRDESMSAKRAWLASLPRGRKYKRTPWRFFVYAQMVAVVGETCPTIGPRM